MKKSKKVSRRIGILGGLIALLFSIYLGPAFSPMMTGHGGGTYWFTLIIMPNVIVIIGGVFVKVTRAGGSILMWIGGIASIIGYGVSPASLFGILFIYGGFKGLGDPDNQHSNGVGPG